MESTALVLGDHVQSITVVRSLARAGYRVVAGRHGRRPASAVSRHVADTWQHPPLGAHERFTGALYRYAGATPSLACIFPVGELEIRALMALESPPAPVAMPSRSTVATCLDKVVAARAASDAGIPVPEAVVVQAMPALVRAVETLAPAVVKCPDSSRTVNGDKAVIVTDAGTAVRMRASFEAAGWPLVVQRYVVGDRHNCHFAAVAGRVVAYFEDRTLRTDRPDGTGYAVDGVSVGPTPTLRAATETLVARLGYHGVGCAQFLFDAGSGRFAFVELNPRLDATCELPYRCGVDFPRLAAACASGVVPDGAALDAYPVGRRFHWLFADLRSVVGRLRRGMLPAREAARAFAAVAASHWQADCRIAWSWSDPLPAAYFYGREFANFTENQRAA